MSAGAAAHGGSPAKHKNRSHIYISIYDDQDGSTSRGNREKQEEEAHDGDYYRWAILVEPYKHHMLSLHHSGTEPLIFFIRREEETSSWACHTRPPDQGDEQKLLVGKILIGESKLATTVGVEELLRARLLPDPETSLAERTSEQWIRGAIRALQDEALVEQFDLDEFMTFARGYVKERLATSEDLAPAAVVEYGDDAKHRSGNGPKKTGRGFWMSYPQSGTSSPARSREASPYGGLM